MQVPSSPSLPLALVVSKQSPWEPLPFVKVPPQLILCSELHPNSKLLLIFLMNQVGYKPVSLSTVDRCLGIHRSTRIRCVTELRDLGFVKGDENHLVLQDPAPVLATLKKRRAKVELEYQEVLTYNEYQNTLDGTSEDSQATKRDYMQEATDAWNRYRPKDYQKIRRISAQLVKAIDLHMRELRVPAHNYDEFFSILKTGVERSEFWSKHNSAKTLQSITGLGNPTDKKRNNVYSLFNDGVGIPATPVEEVERKDTIVYPAKYRKLIDEYEAAQHSYQQANQARNLTPANDEYVIRTEQALRDVGLDPALFRFKYGLKTWPTSTPEPSESRVVNWTYDDEYGHGY